MRASRGRAAFAAAAMVWASPASAAKDEAARRVSVVIADGAAARAVGRDELARMLRIELGKVVSVTVEGSAPPGLEDVADTADTADTVVRLDAESDRDVTIRVPSLGVTRVVELDDVPVASRPRALALAIGEIFHRPPARPEAPPARAEPAAPPSSALVIAASAAVGARWYPGVATVVPGVRLGGTLGFPASRRFELDVDGGYGTVGMSDVLGDVRVSVWSVGAAARVQLSVGRVRIGVGPRGELAFPDVQATASPGARGRSFGGTLITTTVAGRLTWQATDRIAPFVAPEVGVTLNGFEVRADTRVAGGLGGVLGLVHAGIALTL